MYRKTSTMTITALAAGAEEDVTITDAAVRPGDVVVVTTVAAPETGLAILQAWCTAAGTISVRISNLNAAAALTAGAVNVRYAVVR